MGTIVIVTILQRGRLRHGGFEPLGFGSQVWAPPSSQDCIRGFKQKASSGFLPPTFKLSCPGRNLPHWSPPCADCKSITGGGGGEAGAGKENRPGSRYWRVWLAAATAIPIQAGDS